MNIKAQNISKEVFRKYARNYDDHRFILSSIFDYEGKDTYDIVHCRGVLSHTDDKEGAFSRIAGRLKPGGYLIFGDPNKAGGFQNMLQRHIIYSLAAGKDDMVAVAERLFKEDIDRSQKFILRTRRAIIFDRWIVQKQNDASVGEVLQWFDDNGLVLYSAYPPVVFPALGDSAHHRPKFEPQTFKDMGVLTEAVWLMQNDEDRSEVPRILQPLREWARAQHSLVDYLADCHKESVIDHETVKEKIDEYLVVLGQVDLVSHLHRRMKGLLEEAKEVLDILKSRDVDKVRNFVMGAKHLFRGAIGVRHVDFVAYRPS
jgi:SAM-dependent methyltransferase